MSKFTLKSSIEISSSRCKEEFHCKNSSLNLNKLKSEQFTDDKLMARFLSSNFQSFCCDEQKQHTLPKKQESIGNKVVPLFMSYY